MGMSIRFVASYRLFVGEFPLTASDFFYSLFALTGIIAFIRRSKRTSPLTILMLFFGAYFSIFAALNGFVQGRFYYSVLQELRWVLYFSGAYFATISILDARDLKSLVWMFIATSIVVCGWQISTWWTGVDILTSNTAMQSSYYFMNDALRSLRETGLGWGNVGVTIVLLLALDSRGTSLFWFPFGSLIAGAFIIVTVLVATRSFIIPILVTSALQIVLAIGRDIDGKYRKESLIVSFLFPFLLLLSVIVIREYYPYIYSSLDSLWEFSFSSSDETYWNRVERTIEAIADIAQNPLSVAIGLGLGNMSSGIQIEGKLLFGYYEAAHNGYFGLIIAGGLIGLAIYLLMLATACKCYFHSVRASSGMLRSMAFGFGMGFLSINLMMFSGASCLGLWSPLFGIMFGLASIFEQESDGGHMSEA